MKRIQYKGATPLNYDSVLGRSWSTGESDTVDDSTWTALVATGLFSDVTTAFASPDGQPVGGGVVANPTNNYRLRCIVGRQVGVMWFGDFGPSSDKLSAASLARMFARAGCITRERSEAYSS